MTKRVKHVITLLLMLSFMFMLVNAEAKTSKKSKTTKKPVEKKTEEIKVVEKTAQDTILVQFSNSKITKKDLNDRIAKIPPMYQSRYKTIDGQKQVLDAMVQEELFYLEAIAQGFDKKPETIDNINKSLKPIINEKYYQKELAANVKLTDNDYAKFYEENKNQFMVPPSLKIKHLQVNTQGAADSVQTLINEGKSFDDLISVYSTNKYSKDKKGIITNIRHNQYITGIGKDKELDDLIFAKPVDENQIVSAHTESGFHFFQKLEHKAESYKAFDEVKNDIASQLKFKEEQKAYTALIEELKKQYQITIDEEYVDKTDFLSLHPDQFSRIVVNSSEPSLVYDSKRTFDLLRNRYQMEKMNVQDPKIRKSAVSKDVEASLLYHHAILKGFDKQIADDAEVIQTKRTVILRSLYQAEIMDKATVSEDEIKKYYEDNKKFFAEKPYREIRQFSFKTEKEANKYRKKVEKMVKKGQEEKIIALLKKVSVSTDKDGLLSPVYNNGIMPTYGTDQEYNKKAMEIKEKETSTVFKNMRGEFVFFYLVKDVPEKEKTLEELRLTIENNSRRKKATDIFEAKVKEYREKFAVKENYDNLKTQVSVSELFDMAETAQKQNNYREAVHYYDQIIKDYANGRDDYKAWFMKAFVYAEDLKDNNKALQLYQEMLVKWPQGELNESAKFMIETLNGEKDPAMILGE
ncbi:MAG: peptidyl-prolyl cis-trans isomerase [Candidatus Cloacimonetes bacterium]|nr:peptidyl-prolyl cis-trans isomerase [Candidatus Cloacimonadota bacterium]